MQNPLGVRKTSQVMIDFIGNLHMVRRIYISDMNRGVCFPHVAQIPDFLMPPSWVQLLEFSDPVSITTDLSPLYFTNHLITEFGPIYHVTLGKRSLTLDIEAFITVCHPRLIGGMGRH